MNALKEIPYSKISLPLRMRLPTGHTVGSWNEVNGTTIFQISLMLRTAPAGTYLIDAAGNEYQFQDLRLFLIDQGPMEKIQRRFAGETNRAR